MFKVGDVIRVKNGKHVGNFLEEGDLYEVTDVSEERIKGKLLSCDCESDLEGSIEVTASLAERVFEVVDDLRNEKDSEAKVDAIMEDILVKAGYEKDVAHSIAKKSKEWYEAYNNEHTKGSHEKMVEAKIKELDAKLCHMYDLIDEMDRAFEIVKDGLDETVDSFQSLCNVAGVVWGE